MTLLDATFLLAGVAITPLTVLMWLLGGVAAGFLFIAGRRPLGRVGDLVLGLLGGFAMTWLAIRLGFDAMVHLNVGGSRLGGALTTMLYAGFGALVLMLVVRGLGRLRR